MRDALQLLLTREAMPMREALHYCSRQREHSMSIACSRRRTSSCECARHPIPVVDRREQYVCGLRQAADQLLLTREAISGVARRSGLLACFLPKLEPEQPGTGAHCHISLCNVRARGLPPVDMGMGFWQGSVRVLQHECALPHQPVHRARPRPAPLGRWHGLLTGFGEGLWLCSTCAHCHIGSCKVRARSLHL